jgi:DNA-binding CsgD family transcriptional regulator
MDDNDIVGRLDEIARLMALACRRLGPEQESLQEFVATLGTIGLTPTRIAALAGTSPNYVSVALTRSRKKKS